jgi:hypothetical protein
MERDLPLEEMHRVICRTLEPDLEGLKMPGQS